MDIETAHHFRDKSEMKLLFEKASIPCARHKVVHDVEEAASFTKSSSFPYVLKPVAGAGSQETFKINNSEELLKAFQQMGSGHDKEMIMEEFVEGDEFSIDTFSLNGKIIGQTINQYFPTPLEVMKNPWMQWRVVLRKETTGKDFDDIRTYSHKALTALGMQTGISHMEWFRKKDGTVAISEVAARPPGAQFTTLISRACDFDAVRAWVKLMIFDEGQIPDIQYTSGAAYLRSQGEGRVSHVTGIEEVRSKYNDIITDIRLPFKGQEKSASYEGEGFVILRHKESQIVEDVLKDIVSIVKVHNEL
jgi:biotin carboxylase